MIVAVFLLSRLDADTPYWFAGLSMFVMGVGLGFTMQVLVIAVQNSVDRTEIGRGHQLGAVLPPDGRVVRRRAVRRGAVQPARGAPRRGRGRRPARSAARARGSATSATTSTRSRRCPEPAHGLVTGAFSDAMSEMFLVAMPIVVVALVVGLFLKEIPLATRGQRGTGHGGGAGARPRRDG